MVERCSLLMHTLTALLVSMLLCKHCSTLAIEPIPRTPAIRTYARIASIGKCWNRVLYPAGYVIAKYKDGGRRLAATTKVPTNLALTGLQTCSSISLCYSRYKIIQQGYWLMPQAKVMLHTTTPCERFVFPLLLERPTWSR